MKLFTLAFLYASAAALDRVYYARGGGHQKKLQVQNRENQSLTRLGNPEEYAQRYNSLFHYG